MEHGRSWEANSSSASDEILYILWHPTLHYNVQNSPPFVSVPSQINPVHVLTSISWRCTLISPSHVQLGLSFRNHHQNLVRIYLLPHAGHMPCPSHSPSSCHPNVIWWQVQTLKLLIMHFSAVSNYFLPLRHKYIPQKPILECPPSMCLL